MDVGVKVSFHSHMLYLKNEQVPWYCDSLAIKNFKCEGNQDKHFKIWNCKKYSCRNCNFVICESCVSKYQTKSNEEHNKKEPEILNPPVTSNLKGLVNISIHSHPLFLKFDDKKWYCDSLTVNKKCERNQIKKCATFPYKGYQCEMAGCEYTFCDLCVYKYMITSNSETIININVHQHPLRSFSPLPVQWSCCIKNLGKKCLTNISNDDYHFEKAFFCSECKFALCEFDAKKLNKPDQLFDYKLILKKYGNISFLIKGKFGIVFLIEKNSKKFALKVIETFDIEQKNESLHEIDALSRLIGQENILSYENKYVNPPISIGENMFLYQICIEMEYAQKSLSTMILESPEERIDKKLALEIFQQISNGLFYAHSKECDHLDLRPDNILFVDSKCKISHWGGLNLRRSHVRSAANNGYVAPEITDQNYHDKDKFNNYLCDVYSFGVIMLRCCGISKNEILNIPKSKRFHDETIDEYIDEVVIINYPNELCELMRTMCKFEATLRPTISIVHDRLKQFY